MHAQTCAQYSSESIHKKMHLNKYWCMHHRIGCVQVARFKFLYCVIRSSSCISELKECLRHFSHFNRMASKCMIVTHADPLHWDLNLISRAKYHNNLVQASESLMIFFESDLPASCLNKILIIVSWTVYQLVRWACKHRPGLCGFMCQAKYAQFWQLPWRTTIFNPALHLSSSPISCKVC